MYLSMNESIAGGLHLEAENTQGLGVSDIFRNVGGKLEPILVPLDVPVRAVVAPVTNTKIAK